MSFRSAADRDKTMIRKVSRIARAMRSLRSGVLKLLVTRNDMNTLADPDGWLEDNVSIVLPTVGLVH